MARLPVPGQDDGVWGGILNTFLEVAHNSDGTLQTSAISGAGGEITSNKGQANGYAGLGGNGLVPTAQLGSGTANSTTYLRGDGVWMTPNGGSSSLASDSDVTITSPSNNQVLTYNSGSSKWINQDPLVVSVFGRTGAVSAQSGDYTASQVTGALVSTNNLSDVSSAASARTNLGLGTAATENVDSTAADIQPLGVQAAGAVGKVADAGHVHPMPRLDQISAPTAAVSLNSQKITNLANGTAATDAAAFGQIPTAFNQHTVATKTGSYGLTTADEIILADATTAAITLTLPTAVGNKNVYTLKKIDSSAHTVTIATTSSQTIDGSTTAVIKVQYASVSVVSDGSNWYII